MDLRNKLLKKVLFFFVFLIGLPCFSQNSLIEIKVSFTAKNESIEDIFKQIESSNNIVFSYNSEIIPKNKKLSYQCENKPLKNVLSSLLGSDFYFKSAGQHIIILKKNNQESVNSHQSNSFAINGIVVDTLSNKPLALVTVFDMLSMKSTLTDSSGKFNLVLNPKTTYLSLRCSKEGFVDNLKFINLDATQTVKFILQPNSNYIQRIERLTPFLSENSDTISNIIFRTFVNSEIIINSNNVYIADKRLAQMSLLPKFGTNFRMGGSVINRLSINLLGGYSYGVAGFEMGGIVNMNKKNVNGLQIGCLINLTGNDVNGFQASGLLNRTAGNVNGVQISVVSNLGADTVRGIQMAGLINVCKKSLKGLQFSTIMNISRGEQTGSQIAGFLNYAPQPKFQFGLINIADTSNGAPLGVINIIKHGYYSFSFNADDRQFGTFLFAMGTKKMYSMIGIAGRNVNQNKMWGICYGFGTHFMSHRSIGINTEFLSSINTSSNTFDERTISRATITTSLAIKFNKHLFLNIGPTINTTISDAHLSEVNTNLLSILPNKNWHYAPRNTRFDGWFGATTGIKFKI